MTISAQQKKRFRTIGHQLKPTAIVSEQGLTEGVLSEIDLRLEDHELIKVKLHVLDKELRAELVSQICKQSKSELVQVIGKIALIYRPSVKPSQRLSNILRHKNQSE